MNIDWFKAIQKINIKWALKIKTKFIVINKYLDE